MTMIMTTTAGSCRYFKWLRLKQVEAEWQTLDVSEEIVRWMSEM